ncbi:TetR/AcrR family transcriptional regulator [Actinomadura sp. GC306]|uniref:TetR/AcrR family transcriptional regulator n=1 Tax=Actinomadura sp. GC306 TaxID=2530367 RepID=UPI001050DD18|nr:TetR/AcrR family transcriptional regulator [Actinomadura sp. GC306]TDC71818.1 TetR/AcrR family transcriptional regulator [Actinomadura sp. GC306]
MSVSRPILGRPAGARGEETRQRIIEATMRCVAEVGYSRATIREIARAAAMTSGSLYHYFPTKSELIKATFVEISRITVPRLSAAADGADGVMDKLMAVFDESDQLMHEYPYAAAFDRAIRAESAAHLHLAEESDTIYASFNDVMVGIIEQADREGGLGPGVDVENASAAILALMRGLYTHAAASPSDYHATVSAVKLLIRGTLFSYNQS